MSIGQISDRVVSLEQFREKKEQEKASKKRRKSGLHLNLDLPEQVLAPDEGFQLTEAEPVAPPQHFASLSLNKLAGTPQEILEQAKEKVLRAQISYQCALQTYYKFMLPPNRANLKDKLEQAQGLSELLEERCQAILQHYQQVYDEYLLVAKKTKSLTSNNLILLPAATADYA